MRVTELVEDVVPVVKRHFSTRSSRQLINQRSSERDTDEGMDRFVARLANLPHDELVAIAAQGMREGNETRNMGEDRMALHSPLPEWAVTDVLLSPDLLVSVLSTLTVRDGYTASVCKAWQLAWKEKNHGVLRPVRTIKDGNLFYPQHVVALPDGGALVGNWADNSLQPYSAQGEPQPGLCGHVDDGQYQTIRGVSMPSAMALVSDGTMWVDESSNNNRLSRLVKVRLADGKRLIVVERHDHFVPQDLALFGDLLLVLELNIDGEGRIVVLDAATGALQRTINPSCGGQPLQDLSSLCVHGDLVFIADPNNHRIVVCRHTDGAHVRCIGKAGQTRKERKGTDSGEFINPVGVAIGHGRLYVSERVGRRIQVLTLEGLPLQVLDLPDGGMLGSLCVDDTRIWCLGHGAGTAQMHLLTVE